MQTKAGGQKARAIILERYGPDYWRKMGAIGGHTSRKGGFYANRELAREAGRKGGKASKRSGPNRTYTATKPGEETIKGDVATISRRIGYSRTTIYQHIASGRPLEGYTIVIE